MGYSRAEIERELTRRGLPIPKESPQASVSYSRGQIEEELKRRGLPIPKSPDEAFTYAERAAQFAHGFAREGEDLSDVLGEAQVGTPFAPYMGGYETTEMTPPKGSIKGVVSQPIEKLAGRELEPSPNDITGRILHGAGRFSFPAPGSGYVKGATKGIKALGKAIGKETALASGISGGQVGLEEMGFNPLTAGLVSGTAVPLGTRGLTEIGKGVANRIIPSQRTKTGEREAAAYLKQKVGEKNIPEVVQNLSEKSAIPGYEPLSSHLAQNPGISQVQRSLEGISPALGEREASNYQALNEALERIASGQHSAEDAQQFAREALLKQERRMASQLEKREKTLESEIEGLGRRGSAEEAGAALREGLVDKVEDVRQNAQKAVEPQYKEIYENNKEVSPTNTKKVIEEGLKKWKKGTSTRKDLLFSEGLISGEGPLGAEQLEIARRNLLQRMEEIPYNERQRKRELRQVLKAIDVDMETVPGIKETRQTYKELMRDANVIEENPVLKNIIKEKPGYTEQFLWEASEIPEKILNSSKNKEVGRTLYQETVDNPILQGRVKSYINSFLLDKISDNSGNVNIKKLDSFKKDYPGAFELYPELNSRLSNIRNAQNFVNKTRENGKRAVDEYYKGAARLVIDSDPDKMMGTILSGSKGAQKMDNVVKLLNKDKSGDAKKGLQRSVMNYMKTQFSDKLTSHRLTNFLNKNRLALSKLFDEDQMKVMEDVAAGLKKGESASMLGKATGSPTSSNLHNVAEMVGAWGKSLRKYKLTKPLLEAWDFSRGFIDPKMAFIEEAVLNADKMKGALLNPVKQKETLKDVTKSIGKESGKELRFLPKVLVNKSNVKVSLYPKDEEEK